MIGTYDKRDLVLHENASCVPGACVSFKGLRLGGYGIVISCVKDEITVLWSQRPTYFAWAPRVSAKDLIKIQPLPVPTGNIFYLNYKYGDTSGSK